MREVFADTGYWVALINPKENLHQRAHAVSKELGSRRIVTSDMVLAEVLTFCRVPPFLRKIAVAAVYDIIETVEVILQTRRLFQQAFELYAERGDKPWSFADCASFVIMDKRQITEALTHDEHFEQAGLVALLRE